MSAAGATDRPGPFERLRDLLLLALAVVAVFQAQRAFAGFVFEDSYITYRYADNLAAGRGFVFNPGERVLGTSTPLWTMVLAAGARIAGAPVPVVAGWLFAVAWAAFAVLGSRLLGAAGPGRPGRGNLGALFALAVLWGAGGILLVWGMETALDLALLLAALAAARARRDELLGLLLGLAMITRFDTLLFAGLLLGLVALRDRRVPWRAGLLAVAVVLPWLLFSQLYFGAPLPNTLSAKAHDETTADYLRGSLYQVGLAFFTPLLRFGRAPFMVLLPWLWVPLLAPIALFGRRALRPEPTLAVLGLFPLALWLAYGLIGPPVEHTWHMLPAMFLLFALALLALGAWLPRLERSHGATLAVIALLLLSFWQLGPRTLGERERAESGSDYGRRVLLKDELAGVIARLGLGEASLCISEVGYMGYRSGCRMIDATGLITRGVRGHGPAAERTTLQALAAEYDPDLFVMPTRGWPELEGYRALHTSVHLKSLYARERLIAAVADELLAGWLAPAGPDPREVAPGARPRRRPWADDLAGWWSTHDRRPFRDGERAELFTAGGGLTVLTSPPFAVDFDELRFEWQAAGGADQQAELLVHGQVVYREQGEAGAGLRRVSWPLGAFRGAQAVLRFADYGSGVELRARAIRALEWSDAAVLDDFEPGTPGIAWSGDFPPPAAARELAERVGLHAVRGRFSASSCGVPGTRRLVSAPFEVNRAGLVLELLNASEQPALVLLEVDGELALREELAPSATWRALALELGPWRGRRARLSIEDRDPGPGGVVVDGIVLR